MTFYHERNWTIDRKCTIKSQNWGFHMHTQNCSRCISRLSLNAGRTDESRVHGNLHILDQWSSVFQETKSSTIIDFLMSCWYKLLNHGLQRYCGLSVNAAHGSLRHIGGGGGVLTCWRIVLCVFRYICNFSLMSKFIKSAVATHFTQYAIFAFW